MGTRATPTRAVLPSGDQFEINAGGQRATIVEVGGGLREYEVEGRPVLEPYAADRIRDGAHGAPLVPWPNRLEDGRYSFDGATYQVPLTEPEKRNAIHGFLLWQPWEAAEREAEVAMQSGVHASRTIVRRLRGDVAERPFRYRDLGTMATISRFQAVAYRGEGARHWTARMGDVAVRPPDLPDRVQEPRLSARELGSGLPWPRTRRAHDHPEAGARPDEGSRRRQGRRALARSSVTSRR